MDDVARSCPYIGMADDPATHTAYPSGWNCCHHAKPIEVVEFSHQHHFCLTAKHRECPVFNQLDNKPLPAVLRALQPQAGRRSPFNWLAVIIAIIIIAILAIIGYSILSGGAIIPTTGTITTSTMNGKQEQIATTRTATLAPTLSNTATVRETGESQALTQTAMSILDTTTTPALTATSTLIPTRTATPTRKATPTRTLTPTKTLTPSRTATSTTTFSPSPKPFTRSLDSPIGKDYKLIIHQVGTGENLSQFATSYKTSAEAIIRVNYSLNIPLWVDALIVIPVEFTDVAQLPYFQAYRVTAGSIAVETLAKELGTNLNDFITYNDFKTGEQLKAGDWILVPRNQPAF